jgi:MFS family permease
VTTEHAPDPSAGLADSKSRRAWAYGTFRRVWFATVLFSLGNWTERLVVGYFVLNESGSVFLTAATFAARQAPGVFAAPIAGAFVDRWPRNRVLALTAIYKTSILTGLAIVASSESPGLWLIFLLTSFSGIGQSFEIPATQGLVTDSVPRQVRMNAVAVQSVGARGVGALGALVSGIVIDEVGVSVALIIGAAAFVSGALMTLLIRVTPVRISVEQRPRFGLQLFRRAYLDLLLLLRTPAIRVLLIAAVLVEMFGFAFGGLLPSVSVNVLGTAATGIGALTMMGSFGGLAGVIMLSLVGDYPRKEKLLVGITLAYGGFLILLASSRLFPLSMVFITGVGMAAALFDAMQWTLLQGKAPEDMRGRVIGGWVFAIGFGWLGLLSLGALGEVVGVQWALGGAGTLVLATGVVLWRISHRFAADSESAGLA